jgi:hypothetical protein
MDMKLVEPAVFDTSDWNWSEDKYHNADIAQRVNDGLENSLRDFPPALSFPAHWYSSDGNEGSAPDDPATLELKLPFGPEDIPVRFRLGLDDILYWDFFYEFYEEAEPYVPNEGARLLASRLRELADHLENGPPRDEPDRQEIVECSECGVPILTFRGAYTRYLRPGEYVFDGDHLFPQFRHPRCTHPQMSRAPLSFTDPRGRRS